MVFDDELVDGSGDEGQADADDNKSHLVAVTVGAGEQVFNPVFHLF